MTTHTAQLSPADCRNVEALTPGLKAHNDDRAPAPNPPPLFRAQVVAYADAMIARKVDAARP